MRPDQRLVRTRSIEIWTALAVTLVLAPRSASHAQWGAAYDLLLTLSIHDVSGRRVATVIRGQREAGSHSVVWDGRDDRGRRAPSGIYFARIGTASGAIASARIVLTR